MCFQDDNEETEIEIIWIGSITNPNEDQCSQETRRRLSLGRATMKGLEKN